MTFPDPVAFSVLGWPIRWYGLCYLIGIAGTWFYCVRILPYFPRLTQKNLEDLTSWSILGIILGGRLGYVFLYAPTYYWHNPSHILQIWRGGMAFHGGLLGVFLCSALYSWRKKLSLREIGDCLTCGAPLALFLGRIGNFINQEHCGRPTDLPWGIVFPGLDDTLRHPSQLYEAFAEGILLFLLLRVALTVFNAAKKPGTLFGLFLVGYGMARIVCEFFRTPDDMWLIGGWALTAGQLFSLPLILFGSLLWLRFPQKSHANAT